MDIDIQGEITKIGGLSDNKAKAESYATLVQSLCGNNSESGINALLNHVLSDDVPLVLSKGVLKNIASHFDAMDVDVLKALLKHAIDKMHARIVSFEEPDTVFRTKLADIYVEEEEYTQAARTLSGINLERGQASETDKSKLYVRIAELFLEDDETVDAETFINRSAQVIYSCTDEEVKVRHKVSYARILDSKRRFLDASMRYYELSTGAMEELGAHVAEDDLIHLLTKAVICAILASAGPQRSRMLGSLYKDERSRSLTTQWPVLEKMYRHRLLRTDEVRAFETTLGEQHQKTLLSDGSTVLQRAVTEHNVLAASKIYTNVSFEELASILETTPGKAEKIASKMIVEERLNATINQIDGVLEFEAGASKLSYFDSQVDQFCVDITSTVEKLAAMHPARYAEAL